MIKEYIFMIMRVMGNLLLICLSIIGGFNIISHNTLCTIYYEEEGESNSFQLSQLTDNISKPRESFYYDELDILFKKERNFLTYNYDVTQWTQENPTGKMECHLDI